jgi:hypothetical protein
VALLKAEFNMHQVEVGAVWKDLLKSVAVRSLYNTGPIVTCRPGAPYEAMLEI